MEAKGSKEDEDSTRGGKYAWDKYCSPRPSKDPPVGGFLDR